MALNPIPISDRIEAVLVANMSQTDGAVARRDLSDQVADEIVLAAETASGETVSEYADLAAFPITGLSAHLYVAKDTNKLYRWETSAYVEVSPGASFSNGITSISVGVFGLGGSLSQNTAIELGTNSFAFTRSAAHVLGVSTAGRIGIGQAAPATLVNTAAATTNQTDGTTALGLAGFGYEVSQTGYAAAFVNGNNAADSNGVMIRGARAAADSRVLWAGVGTTAGMALLGNGFLGVGLAAPSVRLHARETYANGAEVFRADFGIPSRGLRFYAGASDDFVTLAIGDALLLARNGGSPASITASTGMDIIAGTTKLGTGPGTTLQLTGTGGNACFFGPANSGGPSWMQIGNAANFAQVSETLFRNNRVIITDTNVASTIVASAVFQLNSTTRGFLPPRMTTAQRLSIAAPAVGLVVFDTTNDRLYNFKLSTGWTAL